MSREPTQLSRRALLWIVPLLLSVGLLLASPATVDAATITVNGTGESQAVDQICTLVEALNNANNNALTHGDCLVPGQGGGIVDTIRFQIPTFTDFGCNPSTRVCTIAISTTYLITDPVTIDGYTQTNTSPNTLAVGSNAVIRIRLLPQPGTFVHTGLRVQANDVTIRGLAIGEFGLEGIDVASGFNARIIGCFIGIDPNGTQARGNGASGIFVGLHDSNAVIGGSSPADRNVISGNAAGITVHNADSVTIWGNAIGTNAAGTGGIPNQHGVIIRGFRNRVGGTGPGEGNVIAYNAGSGIRVISGTGNRIVGNVLHSNGGHGIDLLADGVTLNDPGDGDTGPNSLQNYPVLTSVGVRVNTTVHGTLNSTPNRQFRIEFFWNTVCDPSGFGEGASYLGSVDAMTDAAGGVRFFGTSPLVNAGAPITATATDLTTGDTSEFSLCKESRQTGFAMPGGPFGTTEANEGGPVDFSSSIETTTLPSSDVTVPVSVSDPTEGRLVGSSTLTFSATGPPQAIRLLGVDDAIDDGDVPYTVVLGPATSADANYNGLDPPDVAMVNVDNDSQAAQCGTRPKVNVSVVKTGTGQLRATVSVTANPGTQNELRSIAWTRFDTATVVVDGVGPSQVGQPTSFPTLTQSASFVITRTPGAQSGTVRLTVNDVCGAWPTLVGGGPKAW
jgi:hypothetical protein